MQACWVRVTGRGEGARAARARPPVCGPASVRLGGANVVLRVDAGVQPHAHAGAAEDEHLGRARRSGAAGQGPQTMRLVRGGPSGGVRPPGHPAHRNSPIHGQATERQSGQSGRISSPTPTAHRAPHPGTGAPLRLQHSAPPHPRPPTRPTRVQAPVFSCSPNALHNFVPPLPLLHRYGSTRVPSRTLLESSLLASFHALLHALLNVYVSVAGTLTKLGSVAPLPP